MANFKLLNYADTNGAPRAGILVNDNGVLDLHDALPYHAWSASTLAVLNAWDEACPHCTHWLRRRAASSCRWPR